MAAKILQLPTLSQRLWSDNDLLLILCTLKAKQIVAHREHCHVMQNKFLVEYVVSDEGDEGLLVSLVLQSYVSSVSRFHFTDTGEHSDSQTELLPHAIWERQNGVNYVKWYQPFESFDEGRSVRSILRGRHHGSLVITDAVMQHHASNASAITAELRSSGSLLLSTVDEKDNNLWDSSFLSEIAEPIKVVDYGC